ncbi:hypothetical protein GCK32_000933 [Trichostrongylus colubriformis]|uniref:RNA helicase n=1 Tax=Trichostrongylus colubriformis TaxID=6319 RepID=A0AAN8EZJ4_TRICO
MVFLNAKQKLALLSLYSEEIKRRLAPLYNSSERPAELLELLGTNEFDELLVDSSDDSEFTQKLWNALMNSPLRDTLYDAILHYLSTVDEELHSTLCCVSEKDTRSQFSKVLLKLDDFWTYLDVNKTLEFLKGIHYYNAVTTRIEKSLEEVEDVSTKKRVVLRTVPLLGDNAIYDLMRSIYYNSDESAAFVNELHPNFLRFYELLDKERSSPRGVVTFCPANVPIEDIINENSPEAKSESLTCRLLKAIDERSFAETPILLRDYQKELCEKALNGMNTIIAAPTGSGKTIVAVNIIKNHLAKNRGGRKAKVLFMTPNTIIIDQQADCLRKFLGHRYEVVAVCGADNIPLREIINAKDVIVATPQLIVNLLTENTMSEGIEDVIRSPVDVTTFTMMVFDECHRAVKNSPYAMLMRFYHRLSFSKRIPSEAALPQIIGLTASLGVGGKSTEKDAVGHVVKLCAMLNCKVISTVRKNVKELRNFSPIVFDEICFCNSQNDINRLQYLETICDMMKTFENQLYVIHSTYAVVEPAQRSSTKSYDLSEDAKVYRTYTKYEAAPDDKTSQSYLNWVSNHLRRVIPETKFACEAAKTQAVETLEILENLYRAIEMYEDFSSAESFKFLNEQMALKNGSLTDFSRDNWLKYSERLRVCQTPDNVLISELVKQILKNSGKDSRAIVFIRTRRGASVLSEIINKHPLMVEEGVRVECIAGLNKGTWETTTKREQLEKLRRFRDGETRVLIATSVADEGLDVATCNLVIKYNCATNEIAHVQRRGRGRSENSRSILITQNSKLVEQEEKNVLKERLINHVLTAIQESKIDLQAHVEKGIVELQHEIQLEDANVLKRTAQQKASGKVYRLLCSKCDAFLCTSKDVKTYKCTQYCVCDPSFWAKTRQEVVVSASSQEEKFALAKLYCVSPNCLNVLGRIMCIEQIMMPVLSAKACVFEYNDGSSPIRKTERKWRDVKEHLFTPEEVRNFDLAAMNDAAVKPAIKSVRGAPVRLF